MKRTPAYQLKQNLRNSGIKWINPGLVTKQKYPNCKDDAIREEWKVRMKGTPDWYNPEISYNILLRHGSKSKQFENYLKKGKVPNGYEIEISKKHPTKLTLFENSCVRNKKVYK